jgi:ceramide glucosyltransferase
VILLLAAWLWAVACVSGWAFFKRRRSPVAPAPAAALRVAILRPCAGVEPELARCLSSYPGHTGPAPLVLFAVGAASDPALPVAAAAASALGERGVDARVVITSARGPNHKAAQLAVAAREAGAADVLVIADSDVDLGTLDLSALVDPLAADPRVAACWAPPVEHGPARTLGDRASQAVLGASLHAFPLLARLDGQGLVGKLCALRRSSLAAVGGFDALEGVLGEDMELARRFARRGERIVVAKGTARSLASGRDLPGAVARYARWLAVVRRQRPLLLASYPLLFAATPLLVVAALAVGAPAMAGAAVVLRLMVARGAQAVCGRRGSPAAALVEAGLSDALLLAAFTRALLTRDVVWRGARLRVTRGGRLRACPCSPRRWSRSW